MGVGTFSGDRRLRRRARVHRLEPGAAAATRTTTFIYNAGQHDTDAKEFSFPIYAERQPHDPGAVRRAGMQDGLDLIDAVARHPATGPRLARKLYAFFVNEIDAPDQALIQDVARIYYDSGFEIKPMVRRLLLSPQFHEDPANYYKRYSWPVEFVVRALKEVGWNGFSVNERADAARQHGAAALRAAGRQRLGARAGLVLDRRDAGADELRGAARDEPEVQPARSGAAGRQDARALLSFVLDRLTPPSSRRRLQRAARLRAPAAPGPGSDDQLATKASGLVHLIVGSGDYQFVWSGGGDGRTMAITRREFVRGGVAAFTVGFAAPAFLSDLARAQGALAAQPGRALSERRQRRAEHADPVHRSRSTTPPPSDARRSGRRTCCRSAPTAAASALGLNPRLTGLRTIFNAGRLAIIQRTGYPNSSRSHFQGTDIWSTGDPSSPQGTGWLGRYLDTLPSPVDPLSAWSTVRETPRTLLARTVGVPSIPSVSGYAFASPNARRRRGCSRATARRASPRTSRSISRTSRSSTRPRRRRSRRSIASPQVGTYAPTVTYPNNGFAQALRTVAGAIVRGSAPRCSGCRPAATTRTPAEHRTRPTAPTTTLMATLNDGLFAFYRDLAEPGAAQRHADPAVLGVRPPHHRERQQRHRPRRRRPDDGDRRQRARRHLRHRARTSEPAPDNPTLENNGGDVRYETDFRSVYAKVIDSWLGADSGAILGGTFGGAPPIL